MSVAGRTRSGSNTVKRSCCRWSISTWFFTVPEPIANVAYQNKKVVYGILFRAAGETLRTVAADPRHLGAEIGFIAVLHTWGQNLLQNPHS